ncbi:CorA family divalent cation transporter [Rhodococcus sp. H29-C3]|uniref:CorA family divalent cation transporter n=1 Tax=Rhodococcus sp. H29-C3 TaxID=3046307 RepID=UPI0024B9B446|nr:CorA family divalent cation transporter [Rhodococcus sp. H29-C3]MDJ0360235.1 CorA family divalent cation transporter [Rhodococcus sp. H29-C3]
MSLIDARMPVRDIQLRNFVVRLWVAAVSKVVLPMAEVCAGLLVPNGHRVDNEVAVLVRPIASADGGGEGLRDAIEVILSTGPAMQGNSLNKVMEKLTALAAIKAMHAGVVGYFGQNAPFPGYDRALGVWLSTVLLSGLATGLRWSFKRRDWL